MLKMHRTVGIAAALAAVAFYGCEKNAEEGKEPEATHVSHGPDASSGREKSDYVQLKPDAILMRVGTNEISKADIEGLIDLRLKVIRLGLNEAQKNFALNRGAVWPQLVSSLPETYRREQALLKWAAENGISADETDINEYRKGFLRGCKAESADYGDFMSANFTKEEKLIADKRIQVEAICAKARKAFLDQNPILLKSEEIDAFLTRVRDYNAMANATNDLVWARASNIWERVKGGEEFSDIAGDLTEDETEMDENGHWGSYSLGELETEGDLEMAKELAALDIGGTTPPVESDNGVVIAHIDNITDAYGNDLTGGARPFSALYELSRIYLKLALTYEIPEPAESRAEIQAYHEQDAFSKFVNGLMSEDSVEFPSGMVIFEEAKARSQMPRMLMQEGVTQEAIEKARGL